MTSTTGARTLKICMGLALIIMGAIATGVLWVSYKRAEETRHWKPVPAVITVSLLLTERPTRNSPLAYRPEIHYRYTIDGKTHIATRVRRVEGRSSHKKGAEARLEEYPVGKEVTAWVNPAEHDFAILEHSTRAALYSIWFPCLFVVGGLGMVISALRKK
jgi:hypothetical protein